LGLQVFLDIPASPQLFAIITNIRSLEVQYFIRDAGGVFPRANPILFAFGGDPFDDGLRADEGLPRAILPAHQ
jgi:hypothetical protein